MCDQETAGQKKPRTGMDLVTISEYCRYLTDFLGVTDVPSLTHNTQELPIDLRKKNSNASDSNNPCSVDVISEATGNNRLRYQEINRSYIRSTSYCNHWLIQNQENFKLYRPSETGSISNTFVNQQRNATSYLNERDNNQESFYRKFETHSNDCSYECEFCEKSFKIKAGFDKHVRSHTTKRLCACEFCDKSFAARSHLKEHVRTHTGERPYKCENCEKSYTTSSSLTQHTVVHTKERPHKCDHCEKAFVKKYNLLVHTRRHTGERPYKCLYCEKSFITNHHLTKHKRTHTD